MDEKSGIFEIWKKEAHVSWTAKTEGAEQIISFEMFGKHYSCFFKKPAHKFV